MCMIRWLLWFSSMASLFLASIFLAMIISPALSLTCTSQFSNKLYSNCLDLPSLSSYLHFSYNSSNATLSIAFVATPPNSGGWVAWAINPDGAQMSGSQALVAYEGSDGVAILKTYDVASYKSIVPKELSFDVWDLSAEKGSNGQLMIFAKIKVPAQLSAKGTLNQVWQVGPGVSAGGMLEKHDFNPPNLAAKGTLDLNSGRSAGGDSSKTRMRNIHGILNVVSWGILFPVGVIIARYMRTFESADPAWFYLHAFCQVSAYAIGVAGWATGLKLGSESKGIVYSVHRNIGITLFSVATLQIFALFLRPKKDHKIRFYWNIYHHTLGYGIIVLGILNICKGLDILNPAEGWKGAYIIVIAALNGIAVLLEAITWIVVLQRKSRKSTNPYDG